MGNPGELRERVAFEYRAAAADDGYGNEIAGDWTVACTFAARIKPSRGAETVQAARLAGKEPVVITVRSCSDTRAVTTDWRVRDIRKGSIYNIRSIVNPDEKNAYLDMECDRDVAV